MAAFVLRVEDPCASSNVNPKSIFRAFIPCLPRELKQKLEASIEMSYFWGFGQSLDLTSVIHFTKYQGTQVGVVESTISEPGYTFIPWTQLSQKVMLVLSPSLARPATP